MKLFTALINVLQEKLRYKSKKNNTQSARSAFSAFQHDRFLATSFLKIDSE